MDIKEVRQWAKETGKVLQGNLDPGVIMDKEEVIKGKTQAMMENFGCKRHIANLGHGVWPNHEIEKLKLFVDTERTHSAKDY